MSAKREFKEIFAAAEKQGWRIERRGNGKYALHAPNGNVVWASATPSASNAPRNLVADMRRQGFKWRGR